MPRKTKLRTEADIRHLGIDLKYLRELAREAIERFFADKRFHCGGPIPQNFLFCEDSLRTVMGTTIDVATEGWAAEHIHPRLTPEVDQINTVENYDDPVVPFDVHYTLCLIQQLRNRGIPKIFQPGMMLLYYKFCKGFPIPDPPKRILL